MWVTLKYHCVKLPTARDGSIYKKAFVMTDVLWRFHTRFLPCRVNPAEDGDYRLCFDNSFSKVSAKMVFFGVTANRQSSGAYGGQRDVVLPESVVDYKLEDIRVRGGNIELLHLLAGSYLQKTLCWNAPQALTRIIIISSSPPSLLCFVLQVRLDSVHQDLERSRQVLTGLRTREARDRHLLEDNLWRVSFWSCLNVLVLLIVAVTQIYTLRRLFDGARRMRA